MTSIDASRAEANALFHPTDGRHEKGSAMTLIAAEAQATADKTARLRALRLEREAVPAPEAAKPVRKTAKRAAART